jgi:farnesyl-diphosphate farnesyltransferase
MKTPELLPELKKGLKDVARSFYLSLILFPPVLRTQVSVAYFFCKTADTIVDQNHFDRADRGEILLQFYKTAAGLFSLSDFMKTFEAKRISANFVPLFSLIPDALTLFHQFSDDDQKLILEVLEQVISGMKRDLKEEPMNSEEELDQYCYDVAGSAGEFLTKLFFRYQFIENDLEEMISLGEALGKGLQLTNIIRDRLEDDERNRVYLPSGVDFSSDSIIFPKTLSYLENGLKFVISVPKGAWRIRLTSLWPLLFAMKTLAKLAKHPPLNSSQKIKLSRPKIYLTMVVSLFVVFSNLGITLYFKSIRKQIQSAQGERK